MKPPYQHHVIYNSSRVGIGSCFSKRSTNMKWAQIVSVVLSITLWRRLANLFNIVSALLCLIAVVNLMFRSIHFFKPRQVYFMQTKETYLLRKKRKIQASTLLYTSTSLFPWHQLYQISSLFQMIQGLVWGVQMCFYFCFYLFVFIYRIA